MRRQQQQQQRARGHAVPSPMYALLILTVAVAAVTAVSIPHHDNDHHKAGSGSTTVDQPQMQTSSSPPLPPCLVGQSQASGPDSGARMAQRRSFHSSRKCRHSIHHHHHQQQKQQQQQPPMAKEAVQVAQEERGFAASSKHYGEFNTDRSACAEVEGRPCWRAAQCAGCYGLFTCSQPLGKCSLKRVSRNIGAFKASLLGSSSHIFNNHGRHRSPSNRENP